MRLSRICSPLLVFFTLGVPAFCWGPIGHRVVGLIAQHHLTPAAAAAVKRLIGPETLAQVSTWADEIRSDPAWSKATPWHYIDINDNETFETTVRNPKGDIVEAMQRYEDVLRDRSAGNSDKQVALRFLIHFVGDIHQPLHVGRPADQGGNLFLVLWHGDPSNLHSVWDSRMIDSLKLSFTEFTAFIDHPSQQEIDDWQNSSYRGWVDESFALRKQIYEVGGRNLSWKYRFANLPTIKRRLLQAGVRLAGLLNNIFSRTEDAPVPGTVGR